VARLQEDRLSRSDGSGLAAESSAGVRLTGPAVGSEAVAVVLRDVAFTYPGGVAALRTVSLSIPRGKSVGIIGPSGCGKSTLLSILAGQNKPTAGSAAVVSFDKTRHPLAMVFQKDTLLPWLTTVGNIKLYYRYHRTSRRIVDARVRELVQLAGLQGFENHYPYQLSGGMRRRVAFLSAIAATPEILLLDESFSSLDEPTRVAIHQDVFNITRRLGTTMILVTHDLAEAISLCDEVVILTGRPASVFSTHDVPFGSTRDILELRQQPAFLELYGTLWRELSEQIVRSKDKTDG
jgi:NitT/TauT family transport system ATP-binding protein